MGEREVSAGFVLADIAQSENSISTQVQQCDNNSGLNKGNLFCLAPWNGYWPQKHQDHWKHDCKETGVCGRRENLYLCRDVWSRIQVGNIQGEIVVKISWKLHFAGSFSWPIPMFCIMVDKEKRLTNQKVPQHKFCSCGLLDQILMHLYLRVIHAHTVYALMIHVWAFCVCIFFPGLWPVQFSSCCQCWVWPGCVECSSICR